MIIKSSQFKVPGAAVQWTMDRAIFMTLPNLSQPASGKLAERIAESLAIEIADQKFSGGHQLGNEADLAARCRVSRWTVREALTILERQGQINIRRGRYGGIFVADTSPARISDSIALYLEFAGVSIEEIIDARRLLDEALLTHAVNRVSTDSIQELRANTTFDSVIDAARHGFDQYDALVHVARSPVLQTFVHAVARFGQSAILRSSLDDQEFSKVMLHVRLKRREQIEAVIAGQLGFALRTEEEILSQLTVLLQSAHANGLGSSSRQRALRLLAGSRRFKRTEILAQEIASDIVSLGWPVGMRMGSELDLMSRYGVSRSTFREAVRSLEQMGVVEMKVGRHSGLNISSPNPASVVRSSCRSFARLAVTRADLSEAFRALGAGAVRMAADRRKCAIDLTALLENSEQLFFEGIGHASGNRILSLLLQVVANCARAAACVPGDGRSKDLRSMCEAIRSGDAPKAQRIFLSLAPEVF